MDDELRAVGSVSIGRDSAASARLAPPLFPSAGPAERATACLIR
jgi:hypothetical protein